MKIAGQKIEGPNVESIVIPRGDGQDIVFRARAILDYEPFNKLCPEPKPPTKILRGGKKVKDIEAVSYKQAQEIYATKRMAWICLESLQATEDLEWETVDRDDPDTWSNFETELKDAGFSVIEVHRIIQGVLAANCLDESKIDKARESFLASLREATAQSSSPTDELSGTQSGDAASDSE